MITEKTIVRRPVMTRIPPNPRQLCPPSTPAIFSSIHAPPVDAWIKPPQTPATPHRSGVECSNESGLALLYVHKRNIMPTTSISIAIVKNIAPDCLQSSTFTRFESIHAPPTDIKPMAITISAVPSIDIAFSLVVLSDVQLSAFESIMFRSNF